MSVLRARIFGGVQSCRFVLLLMVLPILWGMSMGPWPPPHPPNRCAASCRMHCNTYTSPFARGAHGCLASAPPTLHNIHVSFDNKPLIRSHQEAWCTLPCPPHIWRECRVSGGALIFALAFPPLHHCMMARARVGWNGELGQFLQVHLPTAYRAASKPLFVLRKCIPNGASNTWGHN